MKKLALLLLSIFFFVGCCQQRYIASADTTFIREIERVEIVRDSLIYIKLPSENQYVSTSDTTSTLHTSLATSTATIKEGRLTHSLTNNSTPLPVVIQIKDVKVEDNSNRFITRTIIKEVEVEKALSWWQHSLMGLGVLLILVVIIKVVLNKFIS